MRRLALGISLAVAALLLACGPVSFANAASGSAAIGASARQTAAPLLDRLKTAQDEAAARAIEVEVWAAWSHSGDKDIDELMSQASALVAGAAFDDALAVLDAVVAKAPDFAEGWNKRATLFYLMKRYDRSLADIARVLALEPRHFGALSGMGLIRGAQGDAAGAVAAFRQVLEVDPMNAGAKASIESLVKSLNGAPI